MTDNDQIYLLLN